MLKWQRKGAERRRNRRQRKRDGAAQQSVQQNQEQSGGNPNGSDKLHQDVKQNLQQLSQLLGAPQDLKTSLINDATGEGKVGVAYLEGLAGKEYIHFMMQDVYRYLGASKEGASTTSEQDEQEHQRKAKRSGSNRSSRGTETGRQSSTPSPTPSSTLDLTLAGVRRTTQFQQVVEGVLNGETVLFLAGETMAYLVPTTKWEHRSVEEPTSHNVVRGPHEGFTELFSINMSLLRRRLKTPDLRFELMKVGRLTQTNVGIAYLQGIVDEQLVEEVRTRIKGIQIDGVMESSYIEEQIMDRPLTLFPTVFYTERPDVIASGLLEGQVAIIVDGTPYVLLVPTLFIQFLQSAEDYYTIGEYGLIRILRYIAFFISLLAPALFVAFITFHQEMIPTNLLVSIAAQREGVPFPAVVEAIFMQITFEILREAGVRMPKAIGSAISIVGALVLGEAAVTAGLVSAAMVIVISLTAITSFMIPSYAFSFPLRILRLVFLILAASFGLFGIVMGMLVLFLHLSSLRSFGIPYMSPLAPLHLADQKDALLRFPLFLMNRRPASYPQKNPIRQGQISSSKNPNSETKNSKAENPEAENSQVENPKVEGTNDSS